MKLSKTIMILCAVAVTAAVVTACGKENKPAADSSKPAVTPPASSASEAEKPTDEQTITGVVEDAAMHSLLLKLPDGTLLDFSIPDEADRSKVDSLTIGDTILVTYTGSITGVDTSEAVVTALETLQRGEPVESESSVEPPVSSETTQEPSSDVTIPDSGAVL